MSTVSKISISFGEFQTDAMAYRDGVAVAHVRRNPNSALHCGFVALTLDGSVIARSDSLAAIKGQITRYLARKALDAETVAASTVAEPVKDDAPSHYLITRNREAIPVSARDEQDALAQAAQMGVSDIIERVDVALSREAFDVACAETVADQSEPVKADAPRAHVSSLRKRALALGFTLTKDVDSFASNGATSYFVEWVCGNVTYCHSALERHGVAALFDQFEAMPRVEWRDYIRAEIKATRRNFFKTWSAEINRATVDLEPVAVDHDAHVKAFALSHIETELTKLETVAAPRSIAPRQLFNVQHAKVDAQPVAAPRSDFWLCVALGVAALVISVSLAISSIATGSALLAFYALLALVSVGVAAFGALTAESFERDLAAYHANRARIARVVSA